MSDEKTAPHRENYPRAEQSYEVVLLREGKHQLNATPDDFKRIPVSAPDTFTAMMSDELAPHKEGFVVQYVTAPGMLSEPEIAARRRVVDPTSCRVCMQAPCACKKAG